MKKIVLIFSLSVLFIAQNIISMVEDEPEYESEDEIMDDPMEADNPQKLLMDAIENHDRDAIIAAIDNGAKLNGELKVQDGIPLYPLSYAIGIESQEALKALLDSEGDPDFIDPFSGMSLLSQAVLEGQVDIVKILLEYGADVKMQDRTSDPNRPGGLVPFLEALTLWVNEQDEAMKRDRKAIHDAIQAKMK